MSASMPPEPAPRGPKLPEELVVQYWQLHAAYRALLQHTASKPRAAVDGPLPEPDVGADPTFADLALLESAYVNILPDESLPYVLDSYRKRYRDAVGAAAYEEYLVSVASDALTAPPDKLRAELIALANRLRYIFAAAKVRGTTAIRRSLLIVASAALSLTVLGAAYFRLTTSGIGPSLDLVLAAGILGGSVSALQRLQQQPNGADTDTSEAMGVYNVLVFAPPLGGIFALVLFVLFLTHFIAGDLFPSFVQVADPGTYPTKQPGPTSSPGIPATAADYAKLAVWSFVAGFGERFVPDIVSRLGSRVPESTDSRRHVGLASVQATVARGLTEQLSNKVDAILTGPVLDNYTGFVCVGVEYITIKPGESEMVVPHSVTVWLQPSEPDVTIYRHISVQDGRTATTVTFSVSVDSDSLDFAPARETVTFNATEASPKLQFIALGVTPQGAHEAFVRVIQKNRLLAVVRVPSQAYPEATA